MGMRPSAYHLYKAAGFGIPSTAVKGVGDVLAHEAAAAHAVTTHKLGQVNDMRAAMSLSPVRHDPAGVHGLDAAAVHDEHAHLLKQLPTNLQLQQSMPLLKQSAYGLYLAKQAADSRAVSKAQHYGMGERPPSESKTRTQAAWDMVERVNGLSGMDKREAKIRIRQRARELGMDTSGWSRDAQKRVGPDTL